MTIDIDKLSESELIDLNYRIVARRLAKVAVSSDHHLARRSK